MAVLNWGLGHATRCMPLVRHFLAEGKRVILASDGRALALLREEFPDLTALALPGYRISYGSGNMIWNMSRQLPRIGYAVAREHLALRRIVREYGVDMIVSDNRFGCFHPKLHSYFVTHQLNLKIDQPLAAFLGNAANRFWIRRFDECWVPDYAGASNLSGSLSHPPPFDRVRFIGPLTRMKPLGLPGKYRLAIVLSGPEPQRTMLEDILLEQAQGLTGGRILLVQGKTECDERRRVGRVECVSFLTGEALNEVVCSAEHVVCRSGYSTVMDLAELEARVLFIPTPGQTEQEYLAEHLGDRGRYAMQRQEAVDLAGWLEGAS